jgi:hypothetical protein
VNDKKPIFSIGIFTGSSPFDLSPSEKVRNPVLTREDVSDVQAMFVADPFMLRVEGAWYMFFEVFNRNTGKGEIGLAKSENGFKWVYQKIVLSESFHLSYPYVFQWENEFFMMPESHSDLSIRLYRAKAFPVEWEFAGTLLSGQRFADSSIVYHDKKWWLFTETNPDLKHDTLRLFYAESLFGLWTEHPCSPVVTNNPHIARPAGRFFSYDGKLVRYAQDCYPDYGVQVRAFVAAELGTTVYEEKEISANPVLGPSGRGWNAHGMHHVDPHLVKNGEWLACVDGWVGVDSLQERNPTLSLLKRRLQRYRPDRIKRRLQKYRPYMVARKIKHLLVPGSDEGNRPKVVSLAAKEKPRGNVLLSYIIDGFLLKPGQPVPTTHTNIWESMEIARIFQDLGFNVDIIRYQDDTFIPQKPYSILLDVRDNMERLSPFLDSKCIKIMHLDTKNLLFHNLAVCKRLLDLQKRKGVTLKPVKFQAPNQGLEHAHCGISGGNRSTVDTFDYAGKHIYSVPIPASVSFPWPENKNFDKCRNHFLWFGSSGLVLKGLDLVLDAFAEMPDFYLTVCGPIQNEKDFERLYYKELYQTANIRTMGWVDVNSQKFQEIVNSSVATIFVSSTEGYSISSVNCMHAALIPILSYESGLDVGEFGFVLKESSIMEIKECVHRVARLPTKELAERSRKSWEYAGENHTREKFTEAYRKVIEDIIVTRGDWVGDLPGVVRPLLQWNTQYLPNNRKDS